MNYEFITKMTLKFLEAHLKNNTEARDLLHDPANGNKLPANYLIARKDNARKWMESALQFFKDQECWMLFDAAPKKA